MSSPPGGEATRTTSERLFLALWPDEQVRAQLSRVGELHLWQGGRAISPQNVHMTLVFLGDAAAERRACIEAGVGALRGNGFELSLSYVEWRRRTGIVWVGADQVPSALVDLVAKLQAALAPCGCVPETRSFRPHVTLARHVTHGPRRQEITPISWHAAGVSLVSSRLERGGSDYTVVRRWPLAGD